MAGGAGGLGWPIRFASEMEGVIANIVAIGSIAIILDYILC